MKRFIKSNIYSCFVGLTLLTGISSVTFAQDVTPVGDSMEAMKQVQLSSMESQKNEATLNNNIAEIKIIEQQMNMDCVSAFGEYKFCNCISGSVPWTISFKTYIEITTSQKEVLINRIKNTAPVSKQEEVISVIEATYKARDNCVNLTINKKTNVS